MNQETVPHEWPPISVRRLAREAWSTRPAAQVPIAPAGHGRPVLLVPGFGAPNKSLGRMSDWLRASGWRTYRAPVGVNVNCSQRVVGTLESRAESAFETTGSRLLVIGQSRGGMHARALVGLRPDLFRASIALGSPVLDQLSIRPSVLCQVNALANLGSRGVPGLFTRDCTDGPCCAAYRSALSAPPPDTTRAFSVYSPDDEIVMHQACLDPFADCIAVSSTHQMMGLNTDVWQAIADVLDTLRLSQDS